MPRSGGQGALFEVSRHPDRPDAWCVVGRGEFEGQAALFWGPRAETRARAYAEWLNAGAKWQRRRADPGYAR